MMTALPFITGDLPGLGGLLKQTPEHFKVEEIPLYLPTGQGPHVYLTITRTGLTTPEVVAKLAGIFQLKPADLGYAGLKDKWAVTTQTFSLPLALPPEEAAAQIGSDTDLAVTAWSRHQNKLKVGHLLGNRFTLLLTGLASPPDEALATARKLVQALIDRGLPNYFGEQRFGREGQNVAEARALLRPGRRRPGSNWRTKFLFSALQSAIYNEYLARRLVDGGFEAIQPGDICKKTATGGLFTAENEAEETRRLKAGEISSTGPIFGRKMMAPSGQPAVWEAAAAAEFDLAEEQLAALGAGDRRPNRLLAPDLAVTPGPGPDSLAFTFSLPKGAYATTLMREIQKTTEPEHDQPA